MLQSLRERLSIVLIGLLPFHALFITVATKLLLGPGHAPSVILAVWKEALLAVILVIALIECLPRWRSALRIDLLDGCILGLLVLALIIPSNNFALGFKYDFIPLIAFLVLRRVPWSDAFRERAMRTLLIVGGIVAAYGIVTVFLPQHIFSLLGYSDAHSLYLPNGPIAAYQQITGSSLHRVQSTLSGPNQLGIWLLIPLSICISFFLARNGKRKVENGKWYDGFSIYHLPLSISLAFIFCTALFLTFSRSAWIAAFVIVIAAAGMALPREVFKPLLIGTAGLLLLGFLAVSLWDPAVFFRLSSDRGHFERPIAATLRMVRNPFGLGLGAVGPAANRIHEACVFLEPHDDPSWAKSSPNLCVFVGATQVQPADHVCDCAFLPENWYLQIGDELGLLGFVLYGSLIVLLLWRLNMRSGQSTFLFFLGISIAALFLHAWEESAVAYTAWVLVAVVISARPGKTRSALSEAIA